MEAKDEHLFSNNKKKGKEQIPYILQGSSDEGLRRYNTFKFNEGEKDNPKILWSKYEEQLKITKPNYRAARLDLHYMYQDKNETLDEFVTRCKTKTADCEFSAKEESERIIEQILASTPIIEFKKFILDKPKGFHLDDVLAEGRKHETAKFNMRHIKENINLTNEHSNTQINAIKKYNNKKPSHDSKESKCKCCGLDHNRNKADCPAKSAITVAKLATGK